ncbi:hypothetical protein BUALT_BualtUnG0034600 [Buddleja alternifolia]|uniref:Uncharacterized protein n=1 Tax=Buddleja alternifolia TaxID=168488 RepID=A0AAV6W7B7_9LAMI|nr:hypothetical protein BUALT_BualtUnG0034600 [Buddleja alternifolia]
MSFSGRKRPFYPSPLVVLLIISLLHFWISSQSTAGAIRVFPQRPLTTVDEEIYFTEPPPPAGRNQTEDYSNDAVSDLNNSTSTTNNGTFLDDKRIIPSCPDPLHN